MIGKKIADKITSFHKESPMELHSKELQNDEIEVPKTRHIPLEERQQIIDELRLG